jgi:hypothetical protein
MQVFGWMFGAETHIGVGGQVKNEVRSRNGALHAVGVEQVALQKQKVPVGLSAAEKRKMAGGKIIETNDVMTRRQQPVGKSASNKSCATRNKTPQLPLSAFTSMPI